MTSSSTPPKKKPLLRLLGCLIKVPLGCFGFLLGGAVMLILFLPPSLGRLLHPKLEDSFSRRFSGSLEVEELWIGSFYNDQRIEGMVLRDPEGELVLKGELRAPDMWSLEFGDKDHWGPISLHLNQVNLTQDWEGRTNLERALSFVPGTAEKSQRVVARMQHAGMQISVEFPTTLSFELSADVIHWQAHGKRPLIFEDLVLAVDLKREGLKRRLDGDGQVRIAGRAGEPIRFQWHVEDVLKGIESPWRVVFSGDDVPVDMLHGFLSSLGGLTHLMGPEITSLHLKIFGERAAEKRVELLLKDEGHQLDLRAYWDREKHALVARGGKAGAVLAMPHGSLWAERVMGSAVPLGEGFEGGDAEQPLWMHVREFELPLDGNVEQLQATCTLDTRDVSFSYLENLRQTFDLVGRERLEEQLHLSLRNGILLYNGLSLPAKATIIQLDGGLDLRDGQRHLRIKYKRFPEMELDGPKGSRWESAKQD